MDFRNLNFGRAAERELQDMNPESRKLLEAYARGVNRFIEQASGDAAHGIHAAEV